MITSCKTGSQQSPVMITTNTAKRIPITDLSYNRTHPIMGVFRNNGHAPQFIPDTGSNNELILKNVPELVPNDFVFCDLHFHIGASSNNGPEHILSNHANISGEVHLVHWKRDGHTPTLSAALRDPNGLAVVALFFNVIEDCQGETDRIIQQYVSRIKDVDETKQGYINPVRLYPNRRYYTYRGSLTTPPCSEIVRWILFETPITICRKSFKILQNMETDEEGSVALSVFGNVRPVQRRDVTGLKKNF
ncbi:carbonic anhydrase 2-like isoform X2 [Mizuhopecten yessoensis]|nr:carbonic anhydrase 2-like isoform X2 [Mizuhopecten yessoensis]